MLLSLFALRIPFAEDFIKHININSLNVIKIFQCFCDFKHDIYGSQEQYNIYMLHI